VSRTTHREPAVKLYYRIGEVADLVGVGTHVLRYWETEFRSIRPQKSRKGQRIYSRRDVEKLLKVKELLYTQKFTIAGARKKLRESGVEPGAGENGQTQSVQVMRAVLQEVRQDIVQLLEEMDGDEA